MYAQSRTPLAAGTLVSVLLGGAFWLGAPLVAGHTQNSATKGQSSPATKTGQAPGTTKPSGTTKAPVARPVAIRAQRRGRMMPGGTASDPNHAGVFEPQADASQPPTGRHPREERMSSAGTFDGDLRSLTTAGAARRRFRQEREGPVARPVPLPGTVAEPEPGGVSTTGNPSNLPAPAPIVSFDGLDFATWGAGHPPDTNGDVGPDHYIQTVNTAVGIYRKTDGVQLAAFTFDTLMSQGHFGNMCDTQNFGDPIVVYDSFEDRWVISDFAFQLDASGNVSPPTSFQCFAVSKSGDPVSGGWNFYSINTTGGTGDYPKLGVWPDGLYLSLNMFDYSATGNFQNVRLYAFNKAQMYAGTPSIQVVSFDAPASEFSMLPANARLQTGTPPSGSPNYFATIWNYMNAIGVWKFHVDWNSVSTSTLTGPFNVVTPTSWSQLTGTGAPSPANTLDTLHPRLMMQNQYSRIGGVESLWDSHTVGASGAMSSQAAVRYYQLDVTGGIIAGTSIQAFTYSPDTTVHRFMVSAAVDRQGDLALGYTASSGTLNPALRYAGRLATDPLNTISYSETSMIAGTGSQTSTNRWGDYSAMTLDIDGCTFWYTNEYYVVNGGNDHTRIASFAFPECTPVTSGTLQGTVRSTAAGTPPVAGATVTLGSRTATTDGSGVYTLASLPAGTYPSVAATGAGFIGQTFSAIVVNQNATTTRDFSLAAAPASGCFIDTTQAEFQRGLPTNCDLTSSPGDITLESAASIDQQNSTVTNNGFSLSSTSWAGQTFTPAVSGPTTRIDLDLFCSGCTGTTPSLTVSLRATSGGLPTGADLAVTTIPGFSSGAGGYYSASFATPATLTAGTRYAVLVRAASNPSLGTYAYVCSCFGTGEVDSNPYANGQRVTSGNSGTTWTADTTAGGRDLGFKVFIKTGFFPSGTFVSSIKDANPAPGLNVTWGALGWNAAVPSGTTLTFQAAASSSPDGPFTFVGPDGTAGTSFINGASLVQFSGSRYLRYKILMTSSSAGVTPALHDVTVCFSNSASALAITALTPSGIVAGSGGFPLTVTGMGFVSGAVVRIDGVDRVTAFGSAAQVTAAMLAADVAAATTHTITVANPGGATSNGLTLTVTAPPGTITGHVRDVLSNSAIAAATITINPGGLTASTDGTGLYSKSVAVGTYSVTAAASGHVPLTVTGVAVGSGQATTQDFALAPLLTAAYDATLKAPKCGLAGGACDSGPTLLMGRDTLPGGTEPNQPNTIYSSCPDGAGGGFHVDESNDRLMVSTIDGSLLAPGKTVRIDATVFAYSTPSSDHLDLYYAADATNPAWAFLATLVPPVPGSQTLSANYLLPAGTLQAVRAVFRFLGTAAVCGTNSTYDDHDDLIFATGSTGTHAPSITNAATTEDLQSTSGLVISRNALDTAAVTHFKLSGITGGTLFKNDGTTAIGNNTFISAAEGNAGLKFTPAADLFSPASTFSVTAQAANDAAGTGLGPGTTATIAVTAVADPPGITPATTNEDTRSVSGLVISRNAADGPEVTHFKITNITNGTLFKNNGTTVIANNTVVTFAEGGAGLKFTPAANASSPGTTFSFQAQGATSLAGAGLSTATAAAITVMPVADVLSVTGATTLEDTQTTSGLVITRNAADGTEVTHFKVTSLTNGTLFQNDGTTPILNNAVIPLAAGSAGLKFKPVANGYSPAKAFSFKVQGATSAAGAGLGPLSTATITVTPIADPPVITAATTNEDTQSSTGLVIAKNAADGAEVTHLKITGITNGTLYQTDGTTQIPNGSFITLAQGNAGLKFTPSPNSIASGSFTAQSALDAAGTGLGAGTLVSIKVNAVADVPSVTSATTNQDTKSSTGLVVSRNPVDGAEVAYFKITNIANGTLFQSNGTTAVANNAFITAAQGAAGLRFLPAAGLHSPETTFSFQVQGATNTAGAGLGSAAIATITVLSTADVPSVSGAATLEDLLTNSGLVISRNGLDGPEVTHFKITAITNGTLFQNDGTTPILNNAFITFGQGSAGLRFKPTANLFSPVKVFSFKVQGAMSAAGAGLSAAAATAAITVAPVADLPTITSATTSEDTQTSAGLVIGRSSADGAEVTQFKITGITGGALFKNDGTTPIQNGTFITLAEGNAGLKFTPSPDSVAAGSFMAQGALDTSGTGLGAGRVVAITVIPIADTPSVTGATTTVDVQTTSGLVLTPSPVDGSEVKYFKITNIVNGTLFQHNGTTPIADGAFITIAQGNAGLRFTPAAGLSSPGTVFSFQVQGATTSAGGGLSAGSATATITVAGLPAQIEPPLDLVAARAWLRQ